jgi:hypothetical protein
MTNEIRFTHRRPRVARHDGVAIDTVGFRLAERGREQVAEGGIPTVPRHANDNRHDTTPEDLQADLDHAANAADGR